MSAEESKSDLPAPTNPVTASSVPTDFKLYNPPRSAHTSPRELPDSYFNPTAADLKLAQAQLSARTQSLTNAPLETHLSREARDKAKRDRWPTTTIRVKFPDRTQLERTFPSESKIKPIYAFVRSCLREDAKPIKFILYQTPPKRDLKVSDPKVRDLSLYDLQLAPSSVLLLRFEDESLNDSDVPAPLLPDVLAKAEDLPLPPDFDAPRGNTPGSSGSSTPAPPKNSSSSGEKKIPMWMKLGKK